MLLCDTIYAAVATAPVSYRLGFDWQTKGYERCANVAHRRRKRGCVSTPVSRVEGSFEEAHAARFLYDHVRAVFQLAC
jgi:hypothetical protein